MCVPNAEKKCSINREFPVAQRLARNAAQNWSEVSDCGDARMENVMPSTQDYLKALLELSKNGEPVHSAEVAAAVGVSRASVSRAMSMLKDARYITKEKYGTISLTRLGRETADTVKKHNEMIMIFLTYVLGVYANIAKTDACRMEHTSWDETAYKLGRYLRKAGLL